jgi:hypothetical protein
MLSMFFAAITAVPALVLGGIVVFVLIRYLGTGKQGPSPVRVDPGQAVRLFEAAIAGNKPMVIESLRKAFEFDIGTGKLPAIISEWALFEVEQRVKDPARPAYVIEAVAKFTGLTQEEVLAIVREDFTVGPVPIVVPTLPAAPKPALAATAALLLFFMPSVAFPASPITTWGMPVTGPQRFYEKPSGLIVDPPLMRDAKGQLVEYKSVSYVRYATSDTRPVQPPDGTYYQQTAYDRREQYVGWWEQGPARRFVSAPFRWRPLRRLFGRC